MRIYIPPFLCFRRPAKGFHRQTPHFQASKCIVCFVLFCIVLYCIVLYCIVLYCIHLGSTFRNQVNMVGDQLSAISRRCLELGGRAVATVWLPRRRDDVVAVAAALLQRCVVYRIVSYRSVAYRIVLYCIVLYCIVLYCIVLYPFGINFPQPG